VSTRGITTAIGHTQTLRQLPPLHGPGREIDITARIERKRAVGGLNTAEQPSAKRQVSVYERVLARHTPGSASRG
jgi:hypothetical protein